MADIYSSTEPALNPQSSCRKGTSTSCIPRGINDKKHRQNELNGADKNYQTFKTINSESKINHDFDCRNDTAIEKYDVNSLCQMIMEGKWQKTIRLLDVQPELAQFKVKAHKFMGYYKDSFIIPIHLALLEERVPISMIIALLHAYPEGIQVRETSCQRNCLHIALMTLGSSDSIMSYLIQLHPTLCLEMDSLGRLPIHYAIYYNRSSTVMKELLHVCPNAVKATDNRGWSPLHIACQMDVPCETISQILSASPDMVFTRTLGGLTPYNIAALNGREHTKAILANMERNLNKSPLLLNYDHAVKASKFSTGRFLQVHHTHYIV